MSHSPTPDEARPVGAPAGLVYPWLGLVVGLLAASLAHSLISRSKTIADLFLLEQDLPAVLLMALGLMAWRFLSLPNPFARRRSPTTAAARIGTFGLATLVAAAGTLGWLTVYRAYPLSMDEFMATFDARILGGGRLLSPVPPEWRELVPALQPFFRGSSPDHALWSSDYLPMNAAFRAAFAVIGAEAALNGLWSALAVVATFGVARRLWPERPGAALLAAALVATSTQVLVAGMTTYAMPAHLALNMTWLWLVLRRDWPSQGAAVAVAFAACGLHQLIFHPMFAAPFVLQLWLSRRWDRAAFHTLAYGVIGLFWAMYPGLAMSWSGAAPAAASAGGAGAFIAKVWTLLERFDLMKLGFMPKNLLRFVAWQNPITIVLALAALAPAWRAGGTMRSLLIGIAGLIVAASLFMPFQGHGWGYRYLHGFIGSLALLAAFGWIRLTDQPGEARRALGSGVALTCALSLVVLAPLRLYQVGELVRPYAGAHAAIVRTDADVVFVDVAGLFYADDLVRNDPFLQARPKAFDLASLKPGQVRALCARGSTALFDGRVGAAYGIREALIPASPTLAAARQALRSPPCRPIRVEGPKRAAFTES